MFPKLLLNYYWVCLFFLPLFLSFRIMVHVSGAADSDGRGGVGVGLNRDLGPGFMSVENPCELREKNSSPFSSNRTMFETEEVDCFLSFFSTLSHSFLCPSCHFDLLLFFCVQSCLPLVIFLCRVLACFTVTTCLSFPPPHLDGNPSRSRGNEGIPGSVCGPESVCGGYQTPCGLHPLAQQRSLSKHLQQAWAFAVFFFYSFFKTVTLPSRVISTLHKKEQK